MNKESVRNCQLETIDYKKNILREWTEKSFSEKLDIFTDNLNNFNAGEVRKLFQELESRQSEIEMQNNELSRIRTDLAKSQERYFNIFDKTPIGYINMSEDGVILEANPAAEALFGVSGSSLLNHPISDYICDVDQNIFSSHHNYLKKAGESQYFEIRMKNKHSGSFWAQLNYAYTEDKENKRVYRAVLSDITQWKRSENSLKLSEEKYRLLTENISDVISIVNLNTGVFSYVSPSIYQLRGITAKEAMKERLDETVMPESLIALKELNEKSISRFMGSDDSNDIAYTIDVQQPCRNKDSIWVEISFNLRWAANRNIEAVCVSRDITKRKEAELETAYNSYHDSLTGLYNRRFYEEELLRLDTQRNFPLTVVLGDINGLKSVNDTLGHGIGDELLKKTADAIRQVCRTDDIIARIGGDEFVLLLPKTDASEAEQIILRISKILSGESIGRAGISVSFGHETKTDGSVDIHDAFNLAEAHMYERKLAEKPSKSVRQKLFKKFFISARKNEFCNKQM